MNKGGDKIICELHPYEWALIRHIREHVPNGSFVVVKTQDRLPMTIQTHEQVEVRLLLKTQMA